ncbi:MAG TPA: choice-of-anchor Q domain-containing protein [Thermoleophilaceae bacterium]|nr:choice-of-anchor Q domain-containing protein [Thermoleophilaceae bacterium]
MILLPGDYGSAGAPISTQLELGNAVYVHGEDGQPMPRIFSDAPEAIDVNNPQAVLSWVDIEHSGAANDIALNIEPGTARQVRVHTIASATDFSACSVTPDVAGVWGPDPAPASLIDSVCWSSADGTPAIRWSLNGSANNVTPVLRNVTAIASGVGAAAMDLHAQNGATPTVQATNVIARGALDVTASTSGIASPTATVQLDHSNYATVEAADAGSTITPAGTNGGQTGAPLFANAAAGDFRELAGSPTIDAGVDDPLNGLLDLAGSSRTVGAATDIGAYEFVPPPPAGPSPPAGPPAPQPPGAVADHTKPALGSLKLSHRVFAAARSGASITRHAPVGTTVSYKLSEAATVAFTVQRAKAGRSSGGKCRKAASRTSKKRACTRWVTVRGGQFTRPGTAGANHFHFSGRVAGRKLAPARYRLVGVPSDSAHNTGRPVNAQFRIVRR